MAHPCYSSYVCAPIIGVHSRRHTRTVPTQATLCRPNPGHNYSSAHAIVIVSFPGPPLKKIKNTELCVGRVNPGSEGTCALSLARSNLHCSVVKVSPPYRGKRGLHLSLALSSQSTQYRASGLSVSACTGTPPPHLDEP